jgi:hypothetical protein
VPAIATASVDTLVVQDTYGRGWNGEARAFANSTRFGAYAKSIVGSGSLPIEGVMFSSATSALLTSFDVKRGSTLPGSELLATVNWDGRANDVRLDSALGLQFIASQATIEVSYSVYVNRGVIFENKIPWQDKCINAICPTHFALAVPLSGLVTGDKVDLFLSMSVSAFGSAIADASHSLEFDGFHLPPGTQLAFGNGGVLEVDASGFLPFQDYAGVALTVPEPSAFWMTALGLALVTGAIRVKETTGDTH